MSHRYPILHGVPQCSLLVVLLLYILYIAEDVASILPTDTVSFYADDAQLYLVCRRQSTQSVHRHISRCLASNQLVHSLGKTHFIWCSTTDQTLEVILTPRYITVRPSTDVLNLGVAVQSDLSLWSHVNQLTRRCYSSLRPFVASDTVNVC